MSAASVRPSRNVFFVFERPARGQLFPTACPDTRSRSRHFQTLHDNTSENTSIFHPDCSAAPAAECFRWRHHHKSAGPSGGNSQEEPKQSYCAECILSSLATSEYASYSGGKIQYWNLRIERGNRCALSESIRNIASGECE